MLSALLLSFAVLAEAVTGTVKDATSLLSGEEITA